MDERERRERIEGGYPITAEDAKVFVTLLDAERKRVAKWQTLFYESEEENCSCNIVDTSKPVGDPYNYICDWHQRHPHIAVAREEVITLSERVQELQEHEDAEAAFMAKRGVLYNCTFIDGWTKVLDERDELKQRVQELEGALDNLCKWIKHTVPEWTVEVENCLEVAESLLSKEQTQ